MQLFFLKDIDKDQTNFTLDEATSKHLIQVLRMKIGQKIALTNGNGIHIVGEIIDDNRKRVVVASITCETIADKTPKLVMAVCFTKNKSRNEWMLEKLTELGVSSIVPIIAQRSEKDKWNHERMESIIESAMLQSKQYYLPKLEQPISLAKFLSSNTYQNCNLLVAHCEEDKEKNNLFKAIVPQQPTYIFIGPEGDFTPNEIEMLKQNNALAVSLGATRLRTETAAMYACTIFNAINDA